MRTKGQLEEAKKQLEEARKQFDPGKNSLIVVRLWC